MFYRGVVFDGSELHYLEPSSKHDEMISEQIKTLHEVYHYRHSDIHQLNRSCGEYILMTFNTLVANLEINALKKCIV